MRDEPPGYDQFIGSAAVVTGAGLLVIAVLYFAQGEASHGLVWLVSGLVFVSWGLWRRRAPPG